MRTVIVKLRNEVPPDQGVARIRSLVGEKDLEAVAPLFPGDTEVATASLLELKVRDSVPLGKLIAEIARAPEVEYAHEPATRRPARRT